MNKRKALMFLVIIILGIAYILNLYKFNEEKLYKGYPLYHYIEADKYFSLFFVYTSNTEKQISHIEIQDTIIPVNIENSYYSEGDFSVKSNERRILEIGVNEYNYPELFKKNMEINDVFVHYVNDIEKEKVNIGRIILKPEDYEKDSFSKYFENIDGGGDVFRSYNRYKLKENINREDISFKSSINNTYVLWEEGMIEVTTIEFWENQLISKDVEIFYDRPNYNEGFRSKEVAVNNYEVPKYSFSDDKIYQYIQIPVEITIRDDNKDLRFNIFDNNNGMILRNINTNRKEFFLDIEEKRGIKSYGEGI